ncbi:alpha-ketoglutarate dependent xanthine dioxygenase [Talaromyces proteolyticus]|uniref:Alpha-ketoglutarate dependent xanthine dioxygenase n=1 Tax=Talaromyces proteolyticus TaxID=1131652 RepID=A0AAD4L035_9EURO|nr:alpha-ketoglutarate dependent xanthine dioxygenase [Talaromyces proteolyticus]KAH8703778.1 alpha-ketoglutarate dependent xanthine dioxygenase [Talaromyces proteolyticus]
MSSVKVTPLSTNSKLNPKFGAIVTGADLNNLSDVEFRLIQEAIYIHKVIIVKGQHNLDPVNQFNFVHRLDPGAKEVHGFETEDVTEETTGVLGPRFHTIPGSKGVTVVGQGYQGDDHYGLKGITVRSTTHVDAHIEPLSPEELENQQTRFGAFHFDGVIYGSYPSRVTTLRCVRAPKGPDLTVRWDDGSGRSMRVKPGLTAFLDSAQLYNLLTDEERTLADHSQWEPAPQPYVWTGTRKIRNCGLGMAPGGQTVSLDQLPTWTAEKVYKFPMVWVNPITGVKSFQILPDVVRRLYMKSGPQGEERVVDDGEEIRLWLNDILDRICIPETILVPEYEEGDVVMFNNWEVLHSSIDYPTSYGPRTMHQCHIPSSTFPVGPVSV